MTVGYYLHDTMKLTQQGRSFQIINLSFLCPVMKPCGLFNNKVLPISSDWPQKAILITCFGYFLVTFEQLKTTKQLRNLRINLKWETELWRRFSKIKTQLAQKYFSTHNHLEYTNWNYFVISPYPSHNSHSYAHTQSTLRPIMEVLVHSCLMLLYS